MLEVLILTVVSTVSAPGQDRRQGSTSTDWNSGLFVNTNKSWRNGAASPGQHDIHKMGGAHVGFSYQSSGGSRENIPELSRFVWSLNSSERSSSNCAPSPYVRRVLVVSSCQERAHYSPTSVDLHTGEHRGRLSLADTVCRGGTALSEFWWIARDCKSGPHRMYSCPAGITRFPGTCTGRWILGLWQSVPWITIGFQ